MRYGEESWKICLWLLAEYCSSGLIVAELLMRSLWILFSSGIEHFCKLRAFAFMRAKMLTIQTLTVYTYLRKISFVLC